ncbi:MAG: Bro-N domain-containing protein [Oscillospiraceae bacterium]|nr:Bro-N domain-containing protein [Oscillospiraceae bacterium]
MQNQIQVFQNEEFGKVRVIEKDGQPWWVLKDVCAILGIKNPTQIARQLDDDEVAMFDIGLNNGAKVNAVTESGLYAVILRSDKPQARCLSEVDYSGRDSQHPPARGIYRPRTLGEDAGELRIRRRPNRAFIG